MSLKAKPQPTELDYIRDTVTCMVDVVGETRQEVKQIREHQSEHDKRFDQHDKRFDLQDKRFDQQDKAFNEFKHEVRERFDQLELLIRQFLPKN